MLFRSEHPLPLGVRAPAASSCASGAMERSHVLTAMGVDPAWSQGALRMSLGHTSSQVDVDRAIDVIVDAVTTLRRADAQRAQARTARAGST